MHLCPDRYAAHRAATWQPGNLACGYDHAHYMAWALAEMLRLRDVPVIAYADGSGTVAHLTCGCGVVVMDEGVAVLEVSRHLGLGTNNRAELAAVGNALLVVDSDRWRGRPVIVRTDSMYTIGALTAPDDTREGKPNATTINFIRRHLARMAADGWRVSFEHVKGHSGVEGNERADALAGMARVRAPQPMEQAA